MFTPAELKATLQRVRNKQLFLHQPSTLQFSIDPQSEADLSFFRGAKKHYESGAHFWLKCLTWLEESQKGYQLLMAQRHPTHVRVNFAAPSLMDLPYLYQNITPESFQKIIEEHSAHLHNSNIPHSYHWEGQIQQAMQMSDEWNDQSFIAETESEFLAFFWETSA